MDTNGGKTMYLLLTLSLKHEQIRPENEPTHFAGEITGALDVLKMLTNGS